MAARLKGLTPEKIERIAAQAEQRRHEKRLIDPNPACLETDEKDRPQDTEFNLRCREYEKTHDYRNDRK